MDWPSEKDAVWTDPKLYNIVALGYNFKTCSLVSSELPMIILKTKWSSWTCCGCGEESSLNVPRPLKWITGNYALGVGTWETTVLDLGYWK
jgi:hypothetical protein